MQKAKLIGVAVVGALLAWGGGHGAAAPESRKVPMLAVLVGQTFLRSVVDRDAKTASPLLAGTVNFDGLKVSGRKKVQAAFGRLLGRMKARRRLKKVVVLPLGQARQLFGPPPARLQLPARGDLVVAFGRFRRGGLIAVLAPEGDRWRVIALTD